MKEQDLMNYEFDMIRRHLGHDIEVVAYGQDNDDYQNVSIECNTCNEVLYSIEKYQE